MQRRTRPHCRPPTSNCARHRGHSRSRAGTTVIEQAVVLSVLGILAVMATQTIGRSLDRIAVRAAGREARDLFAAAREHAVASGVRTAVQIDPVLIQLSAHAGPDTVSKRPLGQLHGVLMSSSRDSMAYSPSGLGYGASNLRIILAKHSAAETVTVSRLGRVR